jgi:hypothetical protein
MSPDATEPQLSFIGHKTAGAHDEDCPGIGHHGALPLEVRVAQFSGFSKHLWGMPDGVCVNTGSAI